MSGPEHKKLKDLLNKQSSDGLDGFEKEALEGFDMLSSEQEILDLKASLDTRMQTEVLETDKSKRPFYWIAAAAMLIISGLSAYFILADTNDLQNSKNVAISRPTEVNDAERLTEKSFDDKAAEFKSASPVEEPVASRKKTIEAAPVSKTVNQQQTNSLGSSNAKDQSSDRDDHAESHAIAPPMDIAKPVAAASPKMNEAEESVVESELSTTDEFKQEVKKEKSKKVSNSDAMPSNRADMKSKALALNNCYYAGGKDALTKDLSKKLSEKQLNKSFVAVLMVDDAGNVTSVKFKDKSAFDEKEITSLTSVLKSLDKFNFYVKPEAGKTEEFEIQYQATK